MLITISVNVDILNLLNSSTGLITSITVFGKFPNEHSTKSFNFLFYHVQYIPLSIEYTEYAEMAIMEFLLFVLTATLVGMFLCSVNE